MNARPQELQTTELLELLSTLEYRHDGLDAYLRDVAVGVSRILGVDWSVVTFSEEAGYDRILASSIDLGSAAAQKYALHGTVTERVMATGKPVCVADGKREPDNGTMPEGYCAYIGVPLTTPEGTTVGTICSFHRTPRTFSANAVQIAMVLANRAATALDSFNSFQRLKDFNARLEVEVDARTRELLAAQTQLIRRERLAAIGEFASMIVHEVRSPLSTMIMALEYVNECSADAGAAKRIRLALEESDRLRTLLEEILSYANPSGGQRVEFDLVPLVRQTLERLRETLPEPGATIVLTCPAPPLTITANAHKLRQLLTNLLTNALEASPPARSVALRIDHCNRGASIRLAIINETTGQRIDPARVMQPFVTTKDAGTGLGLPIAKAIVESLGGEFSICQDELGVVTATATLPAVQR